MVKRDVTVGFLEEMPWFWKCNFPCPTSEFDWRFFNAIRSLLEVFKDDGFALRRILTVSKQISSASTFGSIIDDSTALIISSFLGIFFGSNAKVHLETIMNFVHKKSICRPSDDSFSTWWRVCGSRWFGFNEIIFFLVLIAKCEQCSSLRIWYPIKNRSVQRRQYTRKFEM